jgi:two-component system, OmpR family, copper resistance phosphate regulon response regulator CusR
MSAITCILVVDDHVYLAENIAEILESEGYQTRVALSAEQALDTLDQDDIHAVITDYRLPGRNGAQLIREIRRRGSLIPAVVMSAYSDEETIAAARAAGAMEVLTKPVALPQLLGLVAAFQA